MGSNRTARAADDATLGVLPLVRLDGPPAVRPDQYEAIEALAAAAHQSRARVVRTLLDLGLYVLCPPEES